MKYILFALLIFIPLTSKADSIGFIDVVTTPIIYPDTVFTLWDGDPQEMPLGTFKFSLQAVTPEIDFISLFFPAYAFVPTDLTGSMRHATNVATQQFINYFNGEPGWIKDQDNNLSFRSEEISSNPEPATWLMILSGLIFLGLVYKKHGLPRPNWNRNLS